MNLLTDKDNCGECGNVCPTTGRGGAVFECVDGQCVSSCQAPPSNIDCDGIVDNGCETESGSNDNCGGCGIKCLDPAKPCVKSVAGAMCGCIGDKIPCPNPFTGELDCIDPQGDDANCGDCGIACDPAGDGTPAPTNMRYGCVGGKCGKPKCESPFLNCDGNLSNGCETHAYSSDNCGFCGNACDAGLECKGNRYMAPTCSCPPGEVYCPMFWLDMGGATIPFAGACTDLGSNVEHCGGCNNQCNVDTSFSVNTCTFGMCTRQCRAGHADCNGDPLDDCEVNTERDPRNCGGCGIVCDGIAGQACVSGRCVVAPCEPVTDDGGTAR